jgi:hypothetical protein
MNDPMDKALKYYHNAMNNVLETQNGLEVDAYEGPHF